jgi:hypothetical protein
VNVEQYGPFAGRFVKNVYDPHWSEEKEQKGEFDSWMWISACG